MKKIEDMTVKELLDMGTWIDVTFLGTANKELAEKRIKQFNYLGNIRIDEFEEEKNKGWVQVSSLDYKVTITSFYEGDDNE